MKKIFITFLMLIINLSLFHTSFAQVENDIFSTSQQCTEYNPSQQHRQENTCLQDCFNNIYKTSNIQASFSEEKPTKKSNAQNIVWGENRRICIPILYNKWLFYEKKLLHIYYKGYISLVGIVLNIN